MGLPNLAVSQRAQSLSVYDSGEEFTLGRVLFFRVGAQALMSLVTRVWCTHQVFLALMTINFGWYFCVRLAPVSVDKLVTTCAGMCTGVQQRHSPSSVTTITSRRPDSDGYSESYTPAATRQSCNAITSFAKRFWLVVSPARTALCGRPPSPVHRARAQRQRIFQASGASPLTA